MYVNALYIWLNTIGLSLLGALFWLSVARGFSTEVVGLAVAGVSSLVFVSRLCYLGLGMAIVRFIPETKDGGTRLINFSSLLVTVSALTASLIFLGGLPLWSPALRPLLTHPSYVGLFALFAAGVSISTFQDQVFVALRCPHYNLVRNGVAGVLRIGLLWGLVAFQRPSTVLVAYSVPFFVAIAAAVTWLLPRALPAYRPSLAGQSSMPAGMASFAITNHFVFLMLFAPGSLLPLIIANTAGPEAAAYFFVAWAITVPLMAVGVSLGMSLFAEGSATPSALSTHFKGVLVAGSVFGGLGLLFLLWLPQVPLWFFGREYMQEAVPVLRLLAVAALPGIVVNVYVGTAQARKQLKALSVIAVLVFGTASAGGYMLSQWSGATGAAEAWLISQLIGAAWAGVQLRRRPLRAGEVAVGGGEHGAATYP